MSDEEREREYLRRTSPDGWRFAYRTKAEQDEARGLDRLEREEDGR